MSLPNKTIKTGDYPIHIGHNAFKQLNKLLNQDKYKKSAFFILVDNNTRKHCLPLVLQQVKILSKAEIFEVESGESGKNIFQCIEIWRNLSKFRANRKSVFINLGGGVICDMGGFVASAYKRGIEFINIPTTLLSQVDASIGGKVGIDLDHIKNEIGLFKNPSLVIVYPGFLKTLVKREFLSGFAEIIKHALIADPGYWKQLIQTTFSDETKMLDLIGNSIMIKKEIIHKDPLEQGIRKKLNFGHTIGHAIESYFLKQGKIKLLHGEAVAAGMICESYISYKHNKLSRENLNEITAFITSIYRGLKFKKEEEMFFIELMRNDKKNDGNDINFTLLSKIGKAEINKTCSVESIRDSLKYYHEQYPL